jgi:hypothetical protein
MVKLLLEPALLEQGPVEQGLREQLSTLPRDAVVRIDVPEGARVERLERLTAAALRALAPPEMNVEAGWLRRG